MRQSLVDGTLTILFVAVLCGEVSAHPSSGIVVDQKGRVFFQDIVGGTVWKIDENGKLSKYSDAKGGHWLALDADGKFSKAKPKYYQRITPDGVKPALIQAEGGAPLVINSDGNLYYASGDKDDRPGGLALARETPDGKRTSFSPALTKALCQIDDGITGLACGPDGSLYVACWTAVFKVKMDGTVTTLAHPIRVKDCDEDRADHKASNPLPYLRGLAVGADGTVYAAATSCHCLIKITPAGRVETVLKAERPWSPTGVAILGRDVYVLEYTHPNGPAVEGWQPRIRKLEPGGKVTTLATISQSRQDGDSQVAGFPFVQVGKDKTTFVLDRSGKSFTPWGFNYDHDAQGRLIEDYWEDEWPTVEAHFGQMKKLGANVVRVHLQLGKFMDGPEKANEKALECLGKLLVLAERLRLYLDLTGLGCYHKKDVPAWFDKLTEKERWAVQARFWQAVAGRCAESPAVFCYDLMNEPVVPGGKRKDGDWLGPPFAGKHFVQFITLDQADRPRPVIARQWVHHLATAIREKDKRHLITVGLVDWSLDRKGLTSGFVPGKVADDLDFVCVHLYPKQGQVDEALKTLAGFAVGKPVLIEETFPLACSPKELEEFIEGSKKYAAGWIGFYWGKPPEELRRSKTISDALTLGWLELFEKKAKALEK